MNPYGWNTLLVNRQQIQSLSPSSLEEVAESVNTKVTTLASGISSIGNLLACTASNGDTGLCSDAATNLGWMLETLGELAAALVNTSEHLNEEIIRNLNTPAPAKRGKGVQQ